MPPSAPNEYQQHRPEQTVLFGIVRDHLDGFQERCRKAYGKSLPRYVTQELEAYLKCGIHAHGFARAVCQSCGHQLLVAFSCKKRGVCPSCNTRRMSDTAARLVDHVLPDLRLRQWVLSVPFELRVTLARHPDALNACGRIFIQEIFRWQSQRALMRGQTEVRGAAVNFPQRFGGSLNLNVHFHAVVPDAYFYRDHAGCVQHERLPKPSRLDLEEITLNVTLRCLRWLKRHSYISEADAVIVDSDPHEQPRPIDAFLQSSVGLGQLASLERAFGQEQARHLKKHQSHSASKRVKAGVFNVHAATSATARDERERLVRYCARPPLSLQRLSLLPTGQVAYQLKNPIGGRTHRIMEPIDFLARLCALIPPPRHPLIRFHGVLAPNSSWRREVVPGPPAPEAPATEENIPGLSPRLPLTQEERAALPQHDRVDWTSTPLDWATLLKRVYNIDALACPCGGRLRFVELVEGREEAIAVLEAAGLSGAPAPRPAKAPADDHYFYDLTISDANNAQEASLPELDPRPPDEAYFHDPIFDDW